MAGQQCRVGEVLGQQGLADAVGADQHDVGLLVQEAQAKQVLDQRPVDGPGPIPGEVRQRLEATQLGVADAALQAATAALGLRDVQQPGQPVGVADLIEVQRQTVQTEGIGALAQAGVGRGLRHRGLRRWRRRC